MSRQDDGGMLLGGSASVVEQLQLQLEALSTENVALRASIDALRREKEEWGTEKAAMTVVSIRVR
jgi:cell division protein FtsB